MALKFMGKMQLKKSKVLAPKNYSEHLEVKPITALTTIEKKSGDKGSTWTGGVADEIAIHPGMFTSHGMALTVEGGRTLSLGNFEFARVAVTITVPCDPENLEECYEWSTSWISDKIDAAVKEAKGG